MMSPKFKIFYLLIYILLLLGCGGSKVIPIAVENIDNIPLKIEPLSDSERKKWAHLDLLKDTIPGMSIDKTYYELVKDEKGETITVAVIDSGIDIDHEDLSDVIWVNEDEVPDNGKDDDNNGYIDDVNGWNFLGDAHNEQFEFVRIVASRDKTNPYYNKALIEYENNLIEYRTLKKGTERVLGEIKKADAEVSKYLEKDDYTKEDLYSISANNNILKMYVSRLKESYFYGYTSPKSLIKALKLDLITIDEYLDYRLNIDFNGRKAVGDDPNDIYDRAYGNTNVKPLLGESHGTHVAGIVAAKRDNNIGINGVANNVKVMVLRVVPNVGDEYDKDVALAIRYAVDNGARIINTSFGKYYSTNSEWVQDAVIYASENNVLIVSGAGNESYDLDKRTYYPNDIDSESNEISKTFISVGAITSRYGSEILASYSNYGKENVDIFAPGTGIYSTIPDHKYAEEDGTSMAAPAVAGVAALIMSQYPDLTARQVKEIIMKSGLPLKIRVIVDGDIKPFKDLSKSSKIVNAYNALIMARSYTD